MKKRFRRIKRIKNRTVLALLLIIVAIYIVLTTVSVAAKIQETNNDISVVTVTSSDGKKVPVPKGYSASKIPGEDSVNGGFVIYEGDIDWDSLGISAMSSVNSIKKTKSKEIKNEVEINSKEENKSANQVDNTTLQNNTDKNEIDNTISENKTNENKIDNTTLENNTVKNEIDNTILENKIIENETSTMNSENNTDEDEIDNTILENKIIENETINMNSENNTDENEINNTISENVITENMVSNTIPENKLNENVIENTSSESQATAEKNQSNINEDYLLSEEVVHETNNIMATSSADEKKIFDLQCSTNQYVWVPVENVSDLYGVDSTGKLWGKLYATNADETFYEWKINWTETNGRMTILHLNGTDSYREPDVIVEHDYESGYLNTHLNGLPQYEFLQKEMEQFFYETIESIKKYGGFYIGRYETGELSKQIPVVRKMNTDISNQDWYTMYKQCKKLDEGNSSVTTSMIWGTLWDETLHWFIDTHGNNFKNDIYLNSNNYGNYSCVSLDYYSDTNMNVKRKNGAIGTINHVSEAIPTGSAECTKVNNIYDMAGNMKDTTLEAFTTNSRVCRGGGYNMEWDSYTMYYRDILWPASGAIECGCRAMLIIN